MKIEQIEQLIDKAIQAQKNAYAPYSKFYVGAALLGKSGEIYSGCNVENSAYPAGNCAERTATFHAVSCGEQQFWAIAIVGGRLQEEAQYCPPCGICRQVLSEFVNPKTFTIILAKSVNDYQTYTLEELLPLSFGKEAVLCE